MIARRLDSELAGAIISSNRSTDCENTGPTGVDVLLMSGRKLPLETVGVVEEPMSWSKSSSAVGALCCGGRLVLERPIARASSSDSGGAWPIVF